MKKGLATIWAVLITVVIMAGAGFGGWYYFDLQQTKDKDVMNKQIIDLQNQIKDLSAAKADNADQSVATDDTVAVDPYLYTNSTYGFTLQFNSKWQGYKMMPATITGEAATYYVTLPTTAAGYQKATSTSYAGTVSLFAISVFTPAQWATATAEEGPQPTKMGEAGSWVVAYSMAQDYPQDATTAAAVKDYKNVIATFKAL